MDSALHAHTHAHTLSLHRREDDSNANAKNGGTIQRIPPASRWACTCNRVAGARHSLVCEQPENVVSCRKKNNNA